MEYDWEFILRNFVYVDEGNGCWLYKGTKYTNGYGRLHDKRAHRVFYEHYIGPISEGMCVCHTCDIRHCVNPDHLWLGPKAKNLEDMVKKGRSLLGDKHWSRTHPEKVIRGNKHWSRMHPEKVAREDRHASRTHPEKINRSGNGRFTKV